jgi:hypothetical protein
VMVNIDTGIIDKKPKLKWFSDQDVLCF